MRGIRRPKVGHINWFLAGLIIIINGYLLVSPLLPRFDLWERQHQAHALAGLPYKTHLIKSSVNTPKRAAIPADNRLVIPKLALDNHIYTGAGAYLVNLGVWARPNASTPPNGSNTVLIAHRFTYNGPSIFYSLDKMAIGDKVIIYWAGQEYDYTVNRTQIVDATDVAVENPTAKPQLTLYTCTPLWTAEPKNRIVVTASLDGHFND